MPIMTNLGSNTPTIQKKQYYEIAIISFVIMFGELLFVRLLGTEVRVFAYVSNIVLLTIFLGSGLGMLIKKNINIFISFLCFSVFSVLLMVRVFEPLTNLVARLSDSVIWGRITPIDYVTKLTYGISSLFLITILFLLLFGCFIPLGNFLGKKFSNNEKPILSYSINIFFSLLGILAFNLSSLLGISPYFSLILMLSIVLFIVEKRVLKYYFSILLLLTITTGYYLSKHTNDYWSPYQKLSLFNVKSKTPREQGYYIFVNNTGYMGLLDFTDKYMNNLNQYLNENNQYITLKELNFQNQYNIPFYFKPEPKEVLIIGSGGGNDIAGAVRNKATNIDAVEIDPKIVELGKRYHPENPYNSKNVTIYIDDGRAFLRSTNKKYDLIIFGLVDSHTLNTSVTNVQLDNYLYTKESIEQASKLLKDDGVLLINFEVGIDYVGQRIKGSINNSFGHEPIMFNINSNKDMGFGGRIFATNKSGTLINEIKKSNPEFYRFIENNKINYENPKYLLTDDWPYLYLVGKKIPNLHIVLTGIVLSIFVLIGMRQGIQPKFSVLGFILGIGFMLYEFQNISKTSVLYGNTWMTNVFTISAILFLILIGNLIYSKFHPSQKIIWVLLFLTFIPQILIPVDLLNQTNQFIKYICIPLLINLPLLFSSIIFAYNLDKSKDRDVFFASNLLGSGIGGGLSFLSYVIGIKMTIGVCLISYMVGFMIQPSMHPRKP